MMHPSLTRSLGGLMFCAAWMVACSEPGDPTLSDSARAAADSAKARADSIARADSARADSIKTRAADSLSLLESLGPYTVVALGAPPVSGTVSFTDVNDSGLVVGYVGVTGSSPYSYPYRWADGEFHVLAYSGSNARANAVNNAGDVVGFSSASVIWPAGSTQPEEIAPPDSMKYRAVGPVDITDDGQILFPPFGASGVAVVRRSPFTVIGRRAGTSAPRINAGGLVALVDLSQMYPPMYVWSPLSNTSCAIGSHGSTTPIALNDSGELLYSQNSSIGTPYSEIRFSANAAECSSITTIAKTSDATLRTMNNNRMIAGLIGSVPSVGKPRKPFVPLDEVLKRSGGDAGDWHVVDVHRVTNSVIFVATAQKAGGASQLVLLKPAPRP